MTTLKHTEHFDPTIRGLAGKTVKRVRHMTEGEVKGMCWYQNPHNNTYVNHQKRSLTKVEMPPKTNSHAPAFFDFFTKLNFAFCPVFWQ